MAKKKIDHVVEHDIKWDLSDTLENAVRYLEGLIAIFGPDAKLDIDQEYEAYSENQYAYARVTVEREETDDEYKQRVAQENVAKRAIEQHERMLYERLHQKFSKE